jgi:hypothetical protein
LGPLFLNGPPHRRGALRPDAERAQRAARFLGDAVG